MESITVHDDLLLKLCKMHFLRHVFIALQCVMELYSLELGGVPLVIGHTVIVIMASFLFLKHIYALLKSLLLHSLI